MRLAVQSGTSNQAWLQVLHHCKGYIKDEVPLHQRAILLFSNLPMSCSFLSCSRSMLGGGGGSPFARGTSPFSWPPSAGSSETWGDTESRGLPAGTLGPTTSLATVPPSLPLLSATCRNSHNEKGDGGLQWSCWLKAYQSYVLFLYRQLLKAFVLFFFFLKILLALCSNVVAVTHNVPNISKINIYL